MTLYRWSQTAASNGLADNTCPFPEGMAPSAINDGTRGMMAAIAKHRDDISGQITTTGTLNAYTLSSFQQFDSLLDMNGKEVWFTPHVTNGATVTLNVDGLGAKPLRSAPNTELLAGTIIQGTPYGAIYNNTDGAWYLKGFFGNPYNIPLAGGLDYWAPTAPNSSFVFPIGQAISRIAYASLFEIMGVTYGGGDGSTTFNLPNKSGRVSAMLDASASVLSSFSMSPNANTLGATGGTQAHTLTIAEMPSHTHANALNDPGHTHTIPLTQSNQLVSTGSGSAGQGIVPNAQNTGSSDTGMTITNAAQGGGAAHPIVQPTIICNYILRVL